MEVCTPVLSRYAVSDPHIESIGAKLRVEPDSEFFLRTSPEFHMKRLLAAGYPDIFEIGTVFRDGEAGRRHQPEFTMVEWYRLSFSLAEMIDDTVGFITAVVTPGRLPEVSRRTSYAEAFKAALGIDPHRVDLDTLIDVADADSQLREALGRDRDDWLNLLLAQQVVPTFPADRLTVLTHYPASQAALARLCPADSLLADRFEVFVGELELANGYVELTSASEQRRRFAADERRRESSGQRTRPFDENFLAALEAGLPECAGVAVGFDRLVMLDQDCNDIRQSITFAFRQ
jgi:lysyl-tRNA synthetase class 2